MRSIVLGIILFLCSMSAYSQQLWHSGELERVYPQANGSFVITFKTFFLSCIDLAATVDNNPREIVLCGNFFA